MVGRRSSLVVVANRLPVEHANGHGNLPGEDLDFGQAAGAFEDDWRPSPGGLVTALAPILKGSGGTWVGWSGAPDEKLDPFSTEGFDLVPVTISAEEVGD